MRARISEIVARHAGFEYRLLGPCRWPETAYASVEPTTQVSSLQADLAAAFPDYPPYGGAFEFVPHVTIAEGSEESEAVGDDPAWAELSSVAPTADAVEMIGLRQGVWSTLGRFPLG